MKKNFQVLNDCRGMNSDKIFDIILKQRGISDVNEFLYPSEKNLLPLDSLLYIKDAYKLLMNHIELKNKIGVLWDCDLDGVCSGSEMTRYLWNFCEKDNIFSYINNGKSHGLIGQDLDRFKELDLLIIVDSLDKDISQYKLLKEQEIDIIILDHHAIDRNINYDEIAVLVSSQRNYGNPQLSGAGVVWKFCKYIDNQELTDYADNLIDLAACGIIGDMMDMSVMENRYIVSQGLNNLTNPSVKKIVGSFEFNSTAIAFSVAPIVNAANRMFENETVMNLFLADENKEVLKYKKELLKCKDRQKEEVERLFPSIIEDCENQKDKRILSVFIETSYGIGGLIGNKILETYNRPILVLKDIGDSFAGSMRAVGVKDFRLMCEQTELAIANGHELASGIEIKKENYEQFLVSVNADLEKCGFQEQEIYVDVQIGIEDITRELVNKIKIIDRVSGTLFKPVRFYINDIKQYEVSNFSSYKHLVIKPSDDIYIIEWNTTKDFNEMEDHSLCEDNLDCICTLDNGFFGRKFCLKAICDELWTEDEFIV